MTPRRLLIGFTLSLILCLAAHPASAEEVIDTWRSPFGYARSVSVNHADGSCWAATGASVMHLDADGAILSQNDDFRIPSQVSANPTDGSCWVADEAYWDEDSETFFSAVVHLAEDGTELLRVEGFGAPSYPYRQCHVSVNAADGSCWVGHTKASWSQGEVLHLAEDGTELLRAGPFYVLSALSVNPADGSCWVGHSYFATPVPSDGGRESPAPWVSSTVTWHGEVVHLSEDGTELWRRGDFGRIVSVSVNPNDGSCWVAAGDIIHLAADGAELLRVGGLTGKLSVNPTDGSCWVAAGSAVHLAEDGTELCRGSRGSDVSVNPTDGSSWVAARNGVVHLAEDGGELWSGTGFVECPTVVSVNSADGSYWVIENLAFDYGCVIAHLAEDGTELLRVGGFDDLSALSCDPTDGSCWVIEGVSDGDVIVHLAEDGRELLRVRPEEYVHFGALSANTADGSCWVGEKCYYPCGPQVLHLAGDGTELLRVGGFDNLSALSCDPTDGSCWVGDSRSQQVVHLAEDGTELVRVQGFGAISSPLAVNPTDGSCWAVHSYFDGTTNRAEVVHLAQDGTELARVAGFHDHVELSVNPTDGSCWVAHTYGHPWSAQSFGEVVHLAEDGAELWRGHNFHSPASPSVNLADGSCWLIDSGQIVHLVFLPTFEDVPFEHWACDEIAACFSQGIVSGYGERRYQPTWSVSRDQMAVFISRALAGGDENVPDGPAEATFNDVPTDFWAYKYVEYCVITGVVQGFDPVTYGPTATVSRDAMAVFIARAVAGDDDSVPDGPAEATFDDVPTDHWAFKYVEYCVAEEIVHGYDPVTYGPTITVSRDQMAVFICRAFDLPM